MAKKRITKKAQGKEVQGTVGIPAEYFFNMAQHDYTNFKTALPREFYQNSIDAGATEIKVTFNNEKRMITVADDGCGMDRDILINKLLVLGGSHKDEGSVGAFGKAKELLFFSWVNYKIETRNLVCTGKGAHYTVKERQKNVRGTVASITIKSFEVYNDFISKFKEVASLMETDTVIYVDDEKVECHIHRGELVRSFNFGNLYKNVSKNSGYMKVRIDGVWMFNYYVGDIEELVLELSKSSLECLTSNRDSLKLRYRQDIEAFVRRLISDRRNALEPDKTIVKSRVGGTGKVRVHDDILDQIYDMGKQSKEDFLQGILTMVGQNDGNVDLASGRAESVMEEIPLCEAKDMFKLIGYKPDFIVKFEQYKENLAQSTIKKRFANVVAVMWTEAVRQVLLDNRMYIEFTAGFCFEDHKLAEKDGPEGEPEFLINPINLYKNLSKAPLKNRTRLMRYLRERAIHEVAHIREEFHDECFVLEMARLREGTWNSDREFGKIAKIQVDMSKE